MEHIIPEWEKEIYEEAMEKQDWKSPVEMGEWIRKELEKRRPPGPEKPALQK